MEIDLKQLRELLKLGKQFDLAELEVEIEGQRVFFKRDHGMVYPGSGGFVGSIQPQASTSVPPPPSSLAHAAAVASEVEDLSKYAFVTSPFVGTFYRSPSPDSVAFIEVGQTIRAGQILCIVEAMKLMNEIESEVAGVIEEIYVENGKAVEYGDRLFKVRKV